MAVAASALRGKLAGMRTNHGPYVARQYAANMHNVNMALVYIYAVIAALVGSIVYAFVIAR